MRKKPSSFLFFFSHMKVSTQVVFLLRRKLFYEWGFPVPASASPLPLHLFDRQPQNETQRNVTYYSLS